MKIDHINIVTADCDEHILFFTKVFGFKITLDTTLEGEWVEQIMKLKNISSRVIFLESSNKDDCRIELLEFNKENKNNIKSSENKINSMGIRHFAVDVDNIDEIVKRAKRYNYKTYSHKISEVPTSILPNGKKLIYIVGPEGILVEACQVGYLDI